MEASKLNVFHWHLTDAESVPVALAALPAGGVGAFAPAATYDAAAVATVVAHAAARGIRVVPEFDTPAHAGGFFLSRPDLFCGDTYADAVLDPTREAVYEFLDALYASSAKLFPDDVLHVGGDEVSTKCWNAAGVRPRARRAQRDRGLALRLLRGARRRHRRARGPRAHGLGRGLSDPVAGLDRGARSSTLWNGPGGSPAPDPRLAAAVAAGFRAVSSHGFYLTAGDGVDADLVVEWEHLYDRTSRSPSANGSSPLLLGAEAALWGEKIDHRTVDAVAWPRAAVFAARLWSPDAAARTAARVASGSIAGRPSGVERCGVERWAAAAARRLRHGERRGARRRHDGRRRVLGLPAVAAPAGFGPTAATLSASWLFLLAEALSSPRPPTLPLAQAAAPSVAVVAAEAGVPANAIRGLFFALVTATLASQLSKAGSMLAGLPYRARRWRGRRDAAFALGPSVERAAGANALLTAVFAAAAVAVGGGAAARARRRLPFDVAPPEDRARALASAADGAPAPRLRGDRAHGERARRRPAARPPRARVRVAPAPPGGRGLPRLASARRADPVDVLLAAPATRAATAALAASAVATTASAPRSRSGPTCPAAAGELAALAALPAVGVALTSPGVFFAAMDWAGAYPVALLWGLFPPVALLRLRRKPRAPTKSGPHAARRARRSRGSSSRPRRRATSVRW
ncbi:N-acetyl-beta-D-galactosaminidase [Aureococcus anophagefferens]|nr:N-acetyl-beta-D-galactosaminidase [Aureococcus anophagefferens]